MNKKIIITVLVLLLISIIGYMIWDFIFKSENRENPYVYDIENISEVEEGDIVYTELDKLIPEIDYIKGIHIDKQDNIYISGVMKLVIYNTLRELKREFEIEGTPNCITTDDNGCIYLGFDNYIKVIDDKGKEIRSWDSNPNSLFTSIAIQDSMLFVADAGNKVVVNFNLEGDFVQFIGKKDSVSRPKGFIIPSAYFDLLIGRNNELWVVNPGIHTFEAYNFEGEIISSWKRTSMQLDGFSGCCNPSHIAILSDGSFVTSEKGIERVKVHLPNGDFKYVVAEPSKFKKGTKGLDLAVDSKDNIYVLDPVNNEIRTFNKDIIEE